MGDINFNAYMVQLSNWCGFKLGTMEDFDVICQSDLDFLEILLLCEKKFLVNMLDTTKSREDFSTIKDFIGWASTVNL